MSEVQWFTAMLLEVQEMVFGKLESFRFIPGNVTMLPKCGGSGADFARKWVITVSYWFVGHDE
jgi:hypothetical protein